MTCPWCKEETGDCPHGTSAKCMKCGHWFLVPFKEDKPNLQACKQCGRHIDPMHMLGDYCVVCAVPGP